jgi:hypothetical protein
MKHFLLTLTAIASWLAGSAQLTGIVVETYDPTIVAPMYVAPAGMTTYRVYAEFESPLDKVSALFGLPTIEDGIVTGPCQPLIIETTTSWYNETAFGKNLGSEIFSALFPFVPNAAADSWLTIGYENNDNPDASTVHSLFQDPPSLDPHFNTTIGSSLVSNDGAVFNIFTSLNGFGSGPNNRVLLAQLTTTGQISFQLNLQVHLQNNVDNEVRYLGSTDCSAIPEIEVDGTSLGLVYQGPLVLLGCTDPNALNYDESATTEDDSCYYILVYGCTDPNAWNFNVFATVDDETCDYGPPAGCTDPTAINYNASAVIEDGSCAYEGILGCTNPLAVNYNPEATVDDGNCFPPNDCNGLHPVMVITSGGLSSSFMEYVIVDADSTTVATGAGLFDYHILQTCLADGCYSVLLTDGEGDGWDGGSLTITLYGEVIFSSAGPETSSTIGSFSINAEGCVEFNSIVIGCTDPNAINYNPNATVNTSGCTYVTGCTDPQALNYDPAAYYDNGTCTYPVDCTGLNLVELTWVEGDFASVIGWYITHADGTSITFNDAQAGSWNQEFCFPDGCFTVHAYSLIENGWSDSSLTLTLNGDTIFTSDSGYYGIVEENFAINATCSEEEAVILGCTDPAANNYNSQANEDDGSCTYDGLYEGPMAALAGEGPNVYLYPNPSIGDVTVDIFGANGAEALIVTVNDLMGRIIFQRNYGNDQERLRINLESSAYASGVYLLTVQNGAHATTHRLVKQ